MTELIGGSAMHLSRVAVSGLRASAETPMSCTLPGRFSVLIGANGVGKTTLTDALYLAHPGSRFPVLPRPTSAVLAPPDAGVERSIDITYALGEALEAEGRLGRELHTTGHRPGLDQVPGSGSWSCGDRLGHIAEQARAW
ncbi:hypothetical protein GCM10010345_90420 [Streptomyces canarius]|uniref:Rad50/SbcC-type AAA domain-containing protein n=1 Tax=Streptomyces canarius TaxID=285453 RepID=A0ABQ3DDX7_9ACTN|nr:hypothetical protein GCM10010345_90420 [Streptomyces canarius]